MNHRIIKDETKQALVGNRLMFLIAIIINGAIAAGLAVVGVGFLIAPALAAGLFLVAKILLSERKIDFNNLFYYFKNLNHAVTLLVVALVTSFIITIGFLLLIVPGVIFSYQYSQALFISAENPEMSAFDAMKKSKEIMNGKKMDLFIFHLSFIGHFILVAITFGLYALYFMPYYHASIVNYYLHLKTTVNPSIVDFTTAG